MTEKRQNLDDIRLMRPWRIVLESEKDDPKKAFGFVEGYKTKEEALASAKDRNERALKLGVKADYIVIEKP